MLPLCFLQIKLVRNMQILKSTVIIGLKKPLSLFHITDTHLPAYIKDDRENIAKRQEVEGILIQSLEYADTHGSTVVHTGDLMTFCNDENLSLVDRYFGDRDYVFVVGNHDFCREGEYGDDPQNAIKNAAYIAPHFCCDFDFDSRIINDEVNIVTLPNGFFRISEKQVENLKNEVKKGLPIILCMHVPLFTPEHAKTRFAIDGCAHLLAPDEEYISLYPQKFHFHRADEITEKAVEYIKNESAIKIIIAGHTHMNYEEVFENGTVQIVTGANFKGFAREISVI